MRKKLFRRLSSLLQLQSDTENDGEHPENSENVSKIMNSFTIFYSENNYMKMYIVLQKVFKINKHFTSYNQILKEDFE